MLRRDFLRLAALTPLVSRARVPSTQQSTSFADIIRPPDSVIAQTTATGPDRVLRSTQAGRYEDAGLIVTTAPVAGALRVQLASPSTAVRRLRLRWNARLDDVRQILGDAWERGYGDLEWRAFVPDRSMPWYFATYDGTLTVSYTHLTLPTSDL